MPNKKIQTPKAMTIVKVVLPKEYELGYPFKNDEYMLYLGEIGNMPGHCAVVNRGGKVFWGYHPENFKALTADET